MRLEGAHDSRAVNRRARGAETRRPRASGGLCRAWGSLLQGLPPNPMAHGPRDCPRGRSRSVSTRTDSWAYGCKPLLILRNPYTTQTHAAQLKLPAQSTPTPCAKPKQLCIRCLKSLLRLRKANCARNEPLHRDLRGSGEVPVFTENATMAALEEAAARLANVSLTDDAAAAPPALAPPQAPPPLGAALQTQPQAPPPPPPFGAVPLEPPAAPLPPTTPALGRPRSASTASAISELTATPATQAPPSTARRTPGARRSTASPAFSPAFSTMSVRGEIRVPNRRSTFGSTTSSLRSSGSHPWTAAAAAAARRGQEEAFRREANEANIIRADEATTTMTIRPDSPPQRRSLLMDTLTRQLRREQRDSGATRSVGREAPPPSGDGLGASPATPAPGARRRRAAPPSDVTNTTARRRPTSKAGKKPAPALARRGRAKDQPSMLGFR